MCHLPVGCHTLTKGELAAQLTLPGTLAGFVLGWVQVVSPVSPPLPGSGTHPFIRELSGNFVRLPGACSSLF